MSAKNAKQCRVCGDPNGTGKYLAQTKRRRKTSAITRQDFALINLFLYSGFNYNCLSCKSCKIFFHRNSKVVEVNKLNYSNVCIYK